MHLDPKPEIVGVGGKIRAINASPGLPVIRCVGIWDGSDGRRGFIVQCLRGLKIGVGADGAPGEVSARHRGGRIKVWKVKVLVDDM